MKILELLLTPETLSFSEKPSRPLTGIYIGLKLGN